MSSSNERSDPTTTEVERLREEARTADQLGWASPRGSLVRSAYFDRACALYTQAKQMEAQDDAA